MNIREVVRLSTCLFQAVGGYQLYLLPAGTKAESKRRNRKKNRRRNEVRKISSELSKVFRDRIGQN